MGAPPNHQKLDHLMENPWSWGPGGLILSNVPLNSHLLVGIRRHAILTIPGNAIGCRHVFAGQAHRQEARLWSW